jgi:hypothetical protein
VRQLDFVRNVLRHVPAEQLVVASMHIPLACYLDPASPADNTADRRAFLQLLSGRPHTVSFAGHLHATEHHYFGRAEGFSGPQPHHHHVLTAACGSWWSGPRDHRGIPRADSTDGTPNGFHLLSVSGNRYTTHFLPAVARPPAQLRVALDRRQERKAHREARALQWKGVSSLSVPADALGDYDLVANVFDGGPQTTVTYEFVGGPGASRMHRTAIPDPLIVELFASDAPRKAWAEPVNCSHIWKASLPSTLGPGAHRLVVRARDEYGREHALHHVLEVIAHESIC